MQKRSIAGFMMLVICLAFVATPRTASVVAQESTPPLPVVAVHVSELTQAFESVPAGPSTPKPPTVADASGMEWWPTAWHYFVMPESVKEALRADGRNPERAERLTVDAAGEPIVMSMGLPNDEGDGYLRASLALLHRAADRLVSDEDRKALAQSDTIWVERNLERGRSEGVYDALVEAAGLLGTPVPGRDADPATLETAAAALRAALGEARPRWRMGR